MAELDQRLARLEQQIRGAGVPIHGVALVSRVEPGWHIVDAPYGLVRLDFDPAATPSERTQAELLTVAFDPSSSAQQSWEREQQRAEGTRILDLEPAGLAKLIRALALVVLDEVNVLRALHTLPPRTVEQLKTAIRNKITSGGVD